MPVFDKESWLALCVQQMFLDRDQAGLARRLEKKPARAIIMAAKLSRFWSYAHCEKRGVVPMPASATLRTLRGDCKDFAIAAATLLVVAGLEPVLIRECQSGLNGRHMLVYVPGWGTTLEASDGRRPKEVRGIHKLSFPVTELNQEAHLRVPQIDQEEEHRFLVEISRKYREEKHLMIGEIETRRRAALERELI